MNSKTERVELRISTKMLDSIDGWINNQSQNYSRSEAIRELCKAGLEREISTGDKLILKILSDIARSTGTESYAIDHEIVMKAIDQGHYWALPWKCDSINQKPTTRETLSEVCDILDMYNMIEISFQQFSPSDKEEVKKSVDGPITKFPGFDGNHENDHYSIACFLINDLHKYSNFKDRELNSHFDFLQKYKSMVTYFNAIKNSLHDNERRIMTKEQMIELLKI